MAGWLAVRCLHRRPELPADDVRREVGQGRRQIDPTSTDDFEIRKIGLCPERSEDLSLGRHIWLMAVVLSRNLLAAFDD